METDYLLWGPLKGKAKKKRRCNFQEDTLFLSHPIIIAVHTPVREEEGIHLKLFANRQKSSRRRKTRPRDSTLDLRGYCCMNL